MKITYENGWEYMDIHVDLPVPFEENYQMRMLAEAEIPGLMKVRGTGRDGNSRYTFRVRNGISIAKKYSITEFKKADIEKLLKSLTGTIEGLMGHMLSPDGLVLNPELIYTHEGKYEFCYLPVFREGYRMPLCRSFHQLTEYFVGRLDYHDTAGIFLVYKLHRETMQESYELKNILDECSKEEQQYRRELMCRENSRYKVKKEEKPETDIKEKEIPQKKGLIKRTVSKIREGRWGQWQDLITEIEGPDR